MSQRHGHLIRQKERVEAEALTFASVIRGLSVAQGDAIKEVEVKGHHRFGSEATVLLYTESRGQAVDKLGVFPPDGLDIVELRDGGGRPIIHSSARINQHVRTRESIVPFLYSVVQVRGMARHSLIWAHTLPGGIQITIECDIGEDRAKFSFEHLDDVAQNQVLFRRLPNQWFPDGPHSERRGTEWSTVKDVPASLVVWWPWTHPKLDSLKEEAGMAGLARWTDGVEEMARILLEVRLEAHG